MAEAQLQQFLEKVRQLNAFVALSEADPALRSALRDCGHHDEVVALARRCGFEIGRRWGEAAAAAPGATDPTLPSPAPSIQAAETQPLLGEQAGAARAHHESEPGEPPSDGSLLADAVLDPASEAVADRSTAPPPAALLQAGGTLPLLAGPCPPAGEESSTVLVDRPGLRLERIHSCQAVSPPGFWYDQPQAEWVLLLQGSARLRFADEATDRQLHRGDSLWIAAHRRHRLNATDAAPGSIWLALFWWESEAQPQPAP